MSLRSSKFRILEVKLQSADLNVRKSGGVYVKVSMYPDKRPVLQSSIKHLPQRRRSTSNQPHHLVWEKFIFSVSDVNVFINAQNNNNNNNSNNALCFEIYKTRKFLNDKLLGTAWCHLKSLFQLQQHDRDHDFLGTENIDFDKYSGEEDSGDDQIDFTKNNYNNIIDKEDEDEDDDPYQIDFTKYFNIIDKEDIEEEDDDVFDTEIGFDKYSDDDDDPYQIDFTKYYNNIDEEDEDDHDLEIKNEEKGMLLPYTLSASTSLGITKGLKRNGTLKMEVGVWEHCINRVGGGGGSGSCHNCRIAMSYDEFMGIPISDKNKVAKKRVISNCFMPLTAHNLVYK